MKIAIVNESFRFSGFGFQPNSGKGGTFGDSETNRKVSEGLVNFEWRISSFE